MIKVSVMYPNTPGARFNHESCQEKPLPLVKARMGDACKSYSRWTRFPCGRSTRRSSDVCRNVSLLFAELRYRGVPELVSGLMPKRSWLTSQECYRPVPGHPDQ